MSLLVAFLLAQVPPPASGRALPPGAIEIPGPIYAAVRRYDQCLFRIVTPDGHVADEPSDRYRERVERAIAGCAEIRIASVEEAGRKLERTPAFSDPGKRSLAIRHAFEGTEHKWRNMMQVIEQERRKASARAETRPILNVPSEMIPAFGAYFACVTARFSALRGNGGTDSAEMRRLALAACREVRETQLARSVELLTLSRRRSGPEALNALANRTFDEFDTDYPIEQAVAPPPSPPASEARGDEG